MSQEGPTVVVPKLPPFHEWKECPCITEMKLGWGSAGQGLCCLWQRAPQVRREESLLSTEGATRGRCQFSDGRAEKPMHSGLKSKGTAKWRRYEGHCGLRKKFGVGGNDAPIV